MNKLPKDVVILMMDRLDPVSYIQALNTCKMFVNSERQYMEKKMQYEEDMKNKKIQDMKDEVMPTLNKLFGGNDEETGEENPMKALVSGLFTSGTMDKMFSAVFDMVNTNDINDKTKVKGIGDLMTDVSLVDPMKDYMTENFPDGMPAMPMPGLNGKLMDMLKNINGDNENENENENENVPKVPNLNDLMQNMMQNIPDGFNEYVDTPIHFPNPPNVDDEFSDYVDTDDDDYSDYVDTFDYILN